MHPAARILGTVYSSCISVKGEEEGDGVRFVLYIYVILVGFFISNWV